MSARSLIANSGVTLVCTTDDPADSLEWHQQLAQDSSFPVKVLPAWRPDAAMGLERPEYLDYLQRLGQAAGVEIRTYGDLKKALLSRMAFFDKMGCRASDHALTVAVCQPASEEELERVFQKRLEGEPLTQEELAAFQTGFLRFVAGEYKRLGWVMQLHYGCRRNNNTRMFHKLGRDTGYDAVLQGTPSLEVAAFLDLLASQDALPRMVLYSLNPNDDEGLNSVIGCFQDGTPLGRIQQGSAWWFNDHKAGMVKQLTAFANGGLLGNFIGMLTDSRSFLSYPRHEYFRRILCELLAPGWKTANTPPTGKPWRRWCGASATTTRWSSSASPWKRLKPEGGTAVEGKFGAVIVAAGSSRRMGGQGSKVLEDLGGQPVLLYSFRTLASSPWVGELAVVCREEDRPQVEALLAGKTDKPWVVVPGGQERQDSVLAGVAALDPDTPYLLIHDGPGPLSQRSRWTPSVRTPWPMALPPWRCPRKTPASYRTARALWNPPRPGTG